MLLGSQEEVAMVSISHCLQTAKDNLFPSCQRQAPGRPVVPGTWQPTRVELKVRVGSVQDLWALPTYHLFSWGSPCCFKETTGTRALISSSVT